MKDLIEPKMNPIGETISLISNKMPKWIKSIGFTQLSRMVVWEIIKIDHK